MITDLLTNADHYRNLHPGLAAGLDWLRGTDLASLPLGKTVIDGEHLFALIQEYTPKGPELGKLEAHRRYWDIQYVAAGEERMGWVNLTEVTVSEPYNPEREVGFFTGRCNFIRVPAGSFTIFAPQDVHMPGVAPEDENAMGIVRKIVLKVKG